MTPRPAPAAPLGRLGSFFDFSPKNSCVFTYLCYTIEY